MSQLWPTIFLISCIKMLLKPAHRSTDFEVHRNWLAITHSLPIEKWYVDETSPWTLDYPPLFAWFEWILSQVAQYFDPAMLKVDNLNYASDMTIIFQRLSVVVVDFVYAYGCKICCDEVCRRSGRTKQFLSLFVLMFSNAGLFIVDHIHFQYNGFLYGILFISIARMIQGRELESAFWFSVLLNLKHIYLYIAPAFFIYLLRSYCFSSTSEGNIKWSSLSFSRLFKLAFVVLSVFGISFGPFIAKGQLFQVLSRLFPFKRGLSHAYWAPNFWALYNFADKVLHFIARKFDLISGDVVANMSGGLVQEFNHIILPSVPPIATLLATIFSIIPCLIKLWRSPHDPWQFVRAVVLCGFGSFMFGWHVHEKACLLIVLPLGLCSLLHKCEAKIFLLLSIVSHFSLFPLLHHHNETPIKVLALLIHAIISCEVLKQFWNDKSSNNTWSICLPFTNLIQSLYIYGLGLIFLYKHLIHKWLGFETKLAFLPLLITSVYCAIGISIGWLQYNRIMISSSYNIKKKKL